MLRLVSPAGAQETPVKPPAQITPAAQDAAPIPIPTDLAGGEPIDLQLDDAMRYGRKNNLPLQIGRASCRERG